MKTLRIMIVLLFAALVMGGMWYMGYRHQRASEFSSSSVVLEKIRNIHELALVEVQLSEVYDYKDYWGIDFAPFRKKALLLVEGKVKAGFDMEEMELSWYPEEKRISIGRIPQAHILSVEHDLRYYDVQEGTFNGFDAQKLTELNAGAKNFLRDRALRLKILDTAEKRKETFVAALEEIAHSHGWTVDRHSQKIKD